MSWSQKEDFNGFVERKFEIPSKGRQVPGVYWEPKSGAKRLVMLGHGGTMHKRTGYILTLAHLFLQNGIPHNLRQGRDILARQLIPLEGSDFGAE